MKKERNYFNRLGFKVREFRVKRGRKFTLQRKYIEKSKHAIDTRGEKRGLSLAKFLKQRKHYKTTLPKRKITPSQRKVMLRNLAKARRARKRK